MNVSLTAEISADISECNAIQTLSEHLERHFRGRHYGDDVEELVIGIICVSPEFDFFFDVRGLKYVAHKTITHDGISIEAHKCLSYDLKINHAAFFASSEGAKITLLAKSLTDSLSLFTTLPKKVKRFDVGRFQDDMRSFLTNPANKLR